jgi:hypothetical protein
VIDDDELNADKGTDDTALAVFSVKEMVVHQQKSGKMTFEMKLTYEPYTWSVLGSSGSRTF